MPTTPENMDVGFVLICAALVFLMQAGFCMLESGMIRAKNSINVAVKNLLDFGISMLVFAAIGFSVMFGATNFGLFGSHINFWESNDLGAFFLFQMVFCGTAATIVSGAVAERTRLVTYLAVVLVISGFTYPLIGHWCWGGVLGNTGSGWLASLGFVDWAGANVVHVTGGFASLAAIVAIGPRRNYKRGKLTGGHSLTLAIMGCFLLWFGWWGFNGGSGLSAEDNVAIVLLNTNLGAVAGLVAATCWSLCRSGKTDVVDLITGALAGLVSVTAACHAISPLAAIAAGSIGSIVALWSVGLLQRCNADDAVGAFGVHGAAGIWGTMAFAIFAPLDQLPAGSRLMQLGVQSTGVLAASGFSFFTIYGALRLMKCFTRLRVKAFEEKTGLNVIEHGATNEVTDLLGAMHQHRQTGNFSSQIETDTDSEVGQIASEYNAVIARVNEEVVGHRVTNKTLNSEKLRLQSVLEHAGVGIYQLDEEGRFQSANPTLLRIFGYSTATTLIEQPGEFSIPWHHEHEKKPEIENAFERGEIIKDLETEFLDGDGERRWLLESIVPIRDEKGCLLSWLGTVHDVSERKQAMIAEVEIAEAKSNAKGEFLANMSHEIRTPLNGVIGMLDLLSTCRLDRKEENYVSVARSSAESLLSLINDVLDFSKIEAGKLELEHVNFDLRELMESTAEQFAIRAHMKGLEMNCQLASDLPYVVVGDPERLRQSIINLLGNAIKFTETGEINLCVTRRGSVIHFSVQDTGIGISEEAKSSLFESFVQADVSTTRRYGGTGLGLTIVSQLVQLMGGNLKVDSSIGNGSDFWFELPLDVAEEEFPGNQELQNELAALASCNVLVVDDNETNCEILQNQLACWGMQSSVCQQPKTVSQKMMVAKRMQRPFDLIILDFCMPEMNGRDVAIELKANPELCDVPIVMLSSNHDLMTHAELEEVGIDIAMTKPARQSRLFDSIVSVVYKKRLKSSQAHESEVTTEIRTNPSDVGLASTLPLTSNELALSGDEEINDNASDQDKPLISSGNQGQGSPLRSADVLIAEDNQVNQIVVQQMLSSLGYSTDVVANGELALEKVKSGSYGMILMDGHMPIMDGLTASLRIREWELQSRQAGRDVRSTPIVALTANVVSGFKQQCIEAGMDDYLCKPITLERLTDVTQHFLGDQTKVESPGPTEKTNSLAWPSQNLQESPPAAMVGDQPGDERLDDTPIFFPSNTTTEEVRPRVQSVVSQQETRPTYFDQAGFDDRFEGNPEIKDQLLGIMRDTLPERLVELQDATRNNDVSRVRAVAHQLKGAASDTSLVAISESAGRLEHCATESKLSLIPATLFELESRIDATLREIHVLLGE